jgi:hypothetical protein
MEQVAEGGRRSVQLTRDLRKICDSCDQRATRNLHARPHQRRMTPFRPEVIQRQAVFGSNCRNDRIQVVRCGAPASRA